MWTYSQTSGELKAPDGTLVGVCYSGRGAGRNNPAYQDVIGTGPVPQGKFSISEAYETETLKHPVFRLTPHADQEMFGRMGFLIHGDNKDHNASHGCIVADHNIRLAVEGSEDKELEVTA